MKTVSSWKSPRQFLGFKLRQGVNLGKRSKKSRGAGNAGDAFTESRLSASSKGGDAARGTSLNS